MKAQFNKSEIFKAAWSLVKTAGKSISEALKAAWAKAKNAGSATKEIVAKLATNIDIRFNGKVYAGFIYINNEKTAIAEDFAAIWAKAQEIKDTDEYIDLVFDGGNTEAYVLERL